MSSCLLRLSDLDLLVSVGNLRVGWPTFSSQKIWKGGAAGAGGGAEELLESLTAELENFKMTSKALGSEAWDTGKKAESEVFEKTVEMNKDLGMFVNSALENHKKNMSKGAIKIGRNMEQFVRSTTAAAAALDGDNSKRKDLIRNTEMAIKDAKHVLLNAKERFND